jgi:hypothetical protein
MYAFLIPVVHLVTGYKANVRVVADSAAETTSSLGAKSSSMASGSSMRPANGPSTSTSPLYRKRPQL